MKKLLLILNLFVTVFAYCENNSNNNLKNDFLEAIRNNNLNHIEQLLQTGVNPDIEFNENIDNTYKARNPLEYATSTNNLELAKLLLEYNANPNTVFYNRVPALFSVINKRKIDIALELLNYGADIKKQTKYTPPLLHVALGLKYGLPKDPKNDTPELFTITLIMMGADVNKADSNGVFPLSIALQEKKHRVIPFILKRMDFSNPKILNKTQKFFNMGAAYGSFETVRCFKKLGADLNKSALLWAIHYNEFEMVKYLIKLGADPNKKMNIYGQEYTSFEYAKKRKKVEILEYLESNYSN